MKPSPAESRLGTTEGGHGRGAGVGHGSRCPCGDWLFTEGGWLGSGGPWGGRNGVQEKRGPGGDSRARFYNPGRPPIPSEQRGQAGSQGHLEWPQVRGVPAESLSQRATALEPQTRLHPDSCSQRCQVPGPQCISEGPIYAEGGHCGRCYKKQPRWPSPRDRLSCPPSHC